MPARLEAANEENNEFLFEFCYLAIKQYYLEIVEHIRSNRTDKFVQKHANGVNSDKDKRLVAQEQMKVNLRDL